MKTIHTLLGASAIALAFAGTAHAANPTYDPNLTSLADDHAVTYDNSYTVSDTYTPTRAERREERREDRREAREENREERREARRDSAIAGGVGAGLGSVDDLGSRYSVGGINGSGSGNGKP